MSDHELLSLNEAAERYNIPIPTLRDAVKKGFVRGRKLGSQWVVEAPSVKVYLANRPKRGPKPPKYVDESAEADSFD